MFHGSMAALVTPMKPDGEINYDQMSDLVEKHIEAGTDALVVVGTTGESATLNAKEKQLLIRHVVDQAKERLPVIAGTYAEHSEAAAELAFIAMEEGADASLIMTPAYIKPTQEGLYQHYRTISEKAALPIIIYNVPSRTACDILPETLERLSHISNIIGIKEATGSINRMLEIKELCGDTIDIYSGDDLSAKDLILYGGKGVISVTANVAPKDMSEMCQAALGGDKDTANAINQRLHPLHESLFTESNPIPLKWLMQDLGWIDAGIRLPLTQLSGIHQAKLVETYTQAMAAA